MKSKYVFTTTRQFNIQMYNVLFMWLTESGNKLIDQGLDLIIM